MSTFFKALEQAELERALREGRAPRQPEAREVSAPSPVGTVPPPANPVEAPPSPASRPRVERAVERRREPSPAPEPPGQAWGEIDEQLVSLLSPSSFEAEQYRVLRHTVEHLAKTAGLSVVAVSSPTVGDGKTTTAINLAGALAQSPEARVLLVELDLRRASIRARLGLTGRRPPGLVDAILTPGTRVEDLAYRRPPYNLSILLAGETPAAPYEVLKSPQLGELLEQARQRYDYVVLDTPPLVSVPDCRVIGKWVDGFLIVVSAHQTPRKLVEEALDLMEPAKVIGLVFNNDDRPLSGYYYHYAAYTRPTDKGRAGWRPAMRRVVNSLRRPPAA